MATIPELEQTTKNNIRVVLSCPSENMAAKIIDYVKLVLAQSEFLLTDADEFTFTLEQQIARIKSFREHPDKLMITPTINGKVVGLIHFSCGARRKIAHQGSFGMTVHPSHQNIGIGRMMLNSVLDWAGLNPRIETVRLRVHAKNMQAISLYEGLGFIREGAEINGVRYRNGDYDDVILMRKDVSQSP